MKQSEQPEAPGLPAGRADRKNKTSVMLFGLAILLSGAWLIYNFGYLPWAEATDAPSVQLSFKALLMGPFGLVIGLLLLLASRSKATTGAPKKPSWRTKCLLIAIGLAVISGPLLYFWLRSFLKAHGYEV